MKVSRHERTSEQASSLAKRPASHVAAIFTISARPSAKSLGLSVSRVAVSMMTPEG